MDSEKKAKRPRIGASNAAAQGENSEFEGRYEKVNYPFDSHRPTGDRPHRDLHNRMADNQNRPDSYERYSYNNTDRDNGENYQPRHTYQPRQNFQPRQQNYSNRQGYDRQGGYQPRQQNGYNNSGYHNNGYENRGYQSNQGYDGNNGGYRHSQGYNNQKSGYNANRQGGYRQSQDCDNRGYNSRRDNSYRQNQGYGNSGGYQNRQEGYQGHQGFGPRGGGFNNRKGGMSGKNTAKFIPRPKSIDYIIEDIDPNEEIRLNKYMSNAGICSRREADEYISKGLVKVNGQVVTELGTKIKRDDVVEYDEKVVVPERKCYVLLNKPKDCVTTSDDPNGRITVLDIVKNACRERIYPVGRLDRNTTGVLLLTNDGDLASKLTHPKFVKKKIYHVWTDKDISEEDMQKLADGIELSDGEIHADAISYVSETDRNQAGIEIHCGRNRIVRRMFEHLGYRVTKLDRVYFAGLTKKNLPRGRWRYLTQEEVTALRTGRFE